MSAPRRGASQWGGDSQIEVFNPTASSRSGREKSQHRFDIGFTLLVKESLSFDLIENLAYARTYRWITDLELSSLLT